MRHFKSILLGLILTILLSNIAMSEYYYSYNRQIPLYIDSNRVTILFDDGIQLDTIGLFSEYYDRIDSLIDGEDVINDFQIFALNSIAGYDLFIDSLRENPDIEMVNPYYTYAPGKPLLVGNTISCKFSEATSYTTIDSINNLYSLEVVYEKNYAPKEYQLRLTEFDSLTTLDIANIYYEMTETEFCHPNFMGGLVLDGYRVYDYYWSNQWAMQRVFEADNLLPEIKAFEITAGDSDLIIAVLDDGVALHEDIPAGKLLQGYDFCCDDDTPAPCNKPGYGYHGMAVAGIAGASHSTNPLSIFDPNTGICSTAPNCKILPIKMLSNDFDEFNECCPQIDYAKIGRAIDTAWIMGADIISCSWHAEVLVDEIIIATFRAATNGRNGKGCGVFHSAGNTGSSEVKCPNIMPEVISIGAINKIDKIWDYSNYGKIDVVAPGGSFTPHVDKIWSTDQMGELGWNRIGDAYDCGSGDDTDYLCSFMGTSSAQPIAAGVGALVLSRRPDINRGQLNIIIRNSADPYLYQEITDPPHEKYGHGMVHPFRALLSVSRGDANNDGEINTLDITYIIAYLYQAGPEPTPDILMADANCGCAESACVNLLDITYIVDYLYNNGPPPSICFNYDD